MATPHSSRRRKAQAVGTDFAIGMAIFLITLALGIYYTTTVLLPANPFGTQVQNSASQAASDFQDQNSWNVYSTPITIQSSQQIDNYPIELDYLYPDSLDKNSTLLMDGSTELRSQTDYSLNQTTWLTNLSQGRNRVELVYTQDTRLPDRTHTKNVHRAGDNLWNTDLNLTLDSEGIDNLTFDSSEQLILNADLNTSDTSRSYTEGPVRIHAQYNTPDPQTYRIFGNSNQIRFNHNQSGTAVYHINLSSSFDTLYVSQGDQTITMDENGTYFTGTTDFIDLSYTDGTTYGLGIASKGMDVYVYRNETGGDIWLNATMPDNGVRRTLLLPHTGDHTAIDSARILFLDQANTTASLTRKLQGLSRNKLEQFESQTTDQIRLDLGLENLGFNISIDGIFDAGENIPPGQEISALEHPTTLLDRWANSTITTLQLRVWI